MQKIIAPETAEDLPDLIPVKEAAKLLPSGRAGKRVHVSTLVRWIREGRLPGYRIGRAVMVSASDLGRFVRGNRIKAAEPIVTKPSAAEQRYIDDALRRHGI